MSREATEPIGIIEAAHRLAKLDPEAVRVLLAELDTARSIDHSDPYAYARALGKIDGGVRAALLVALAVEELSA